MIAAQACRTIAVGGKAGVAGQAMTGGDGSLRAAHGAMGHAGEPREPPRIANMYRITYN